MSKICIISHLNSIFLALTSILEKVAVKQLLSNFAYSLMENSSSNEILHDFPNFIRIYKDGRCERQMGTAVVPAGTDPSTGVQSKDVLISPEINLSARLYIPKTVPKDQKLPVLIFFHGGAFVIESASSPTYQNFLNKFVAEANILVVSVNYRLAPEFPLPIGYDDSWAAIKWVASHINGNGQDTWLNQYGDFNRVFFAGDSAGGNIAHHMGVRIGLEKLDGLKITGIILIHPYFLGKDPIGAESGEFAPYKETTDLLWRVAKPDTSGSDDPLINPATCPNLSELACSKVLVCVGEKDLLRDRGWYYYKVLGQSGWGGKLELMESKGEGHVFFLFDLDSENAAHLFKKMASFINQA